MLSELIYLPISKGTVDKIVDYVGGDSSRFSELMHHFLSDNVRVSQLTSWAVGNIAEVHTDLINPFHLELVNQLKTKNTHNAIRRNVARIYQTAPIPEEIEGQLYDTCLNAIINPNEAIAIRAFSMRVCERIALKYPELIPELIESIAIQLPIGSAGIKNRGAKTIKRLEKKID